MSWTGKKSSSALVIRPHQRPQPSGAANTTNPNPMNGSKQKEFLRLSRAVEQELGQQTDTIRQLQDKLLRKFDQITAADDDNSHAQKIFNKSQTHSLSDSHHVDASLSFDSSPFTFHLPDPLPFSVHNVAIPKFTSADQDRVRTLEEMSQEWSAQKETHSFQLLNHSSINPLSISDNNVSRLLPTTAASPSASPIELKRSNPSFVSSLLRQSHANEELKEKPTHPSASESISIPLSLSSAHNSQHSSWPLKDRTNLHAEKQQHQHRSTEFPALDRAVFKHIEGQTNDMFPALARALQLRQQRLQVTPDPAELSQSQKEYSSLRHSKVQNPSFDKSKQQSSNTTPSDLHQSNDHSTPSVVDQQHTVSANTKLGSGVTLSDLESGASPPKAQPSHSKVQSSAVAIPLEPEDDVGQLLRQQALQLIANQVQTRIRLLTRQRVFRIWRFQYKLTRAVNIVARKRLQSALRKWQAESRAERTRKDRAAIKVQTCFRRHHAASNYPKLRMAAKFRSISLLRLVFYHWHARVARVSRFKRLWQEKVAWGGSQTPYRSRITFPSRRWRSTEGTTVMAEQYCRWRMLCICYTKWLRFIAEQKLFDKPSAQSKAVSWKQRT